jgi:flagellar assembly factor FliW
MILSTRFYGDKDIDDNQILALPYGVPGFGHLTQWALFPAEQSPFMVLQSCEDIHVSFAVVDPCLLYVDYDPQLDEADYQALQLSGHNDPQCAFFVIVTIPGQSIQQATINMQAPLVVNLQQRIAAQCLGHSHFWLLHHPLFPSDTQGTPTC